MKVVKQRCSLQGMLLAISSELLALSPKLKADLDTRRKTVAQEILRIGIYWYLPELLKCVMEKTWRGELNQYRVCELIARHCGDCLVWGSHATDLDAVSILKCQRPDFISEMSNVMKNYLPIELHNPQVKKWKDNVFIRWEKDDEWKKFKEMREKLMEKAMDFIIVEQVHWEVINALKQTVEALKAAGTEPNPYLEKFSEALNNLITRISQKPLSLIHAPNVPLDWYVRRLADGQDIQEGKLPFPPNPHISVATAVRYDEKYNMSPKEVGNFICEEIGNVPGWSSLLGNTVIHHIESAHVVELEPTSVEPLKVTVIDRLSGKERIERRSRCIAKERLPL